MCITVESQRFQACMNFLIFLTLITFVLAVLMAFLANQASEKTWLSVPSYELIQGFYFFLVATYGICYIMLICNSFAQYENKPKLFSCWNIKMMILSLLISYPSGWSVTYMQDIISQKAEFLLPENAVMSTTNKASPMFPLTEVVRKSYNEIVCTNECACPLNLGHYEDNQDVLVIDIRKDEQCDISQNKKCLYYDITSEGYNVEKCLEGNEKIGQDLYGLNKDFVIDVLGLLADLEEKKQCSGGISDPNFKLPLYLFSNVNNGIPKYSCHQFIVEQISDNMHAFLAGTVIMLVFNYGYMAGFILVLFAKIWRYCRRNKGGNQQNNEKGGGQKDKMAEQDHNGIHVELADQDDGEDKQNKDDPESGKKLKAANKEAQNNGKSGQTANGEKDTKQ